MQNLLNHNLYLSIISILAAITMVFIFAGILLFCFLLCLIYFLRNKIRKHFPEKDHIQTFAAPRPAIIYYPNTAKSKKHLLTVQESNCDLENNSTEKKSISNENIDRDKECLPEITQQTQDKKCLPNTPQENTFYRPRRSVHIKNLDFSKVNITNEGKYTLRTLISEHDEEIYWQAKMQRIEEMEKRANERNRRYFAQKESEKNNKQKSK